MYRSISILAAAAAIAFTASPAQADDTRSVTVMVYATDFGTPQARTALDHRIQSALEDLCGVNAAAEGVDWGDIKKCRAKARRDIYGQIASLKISSPVQLSAR
ncbi:MAG TPA: UrcA family protein [Sphingomicrobium sp.]|jgi:UrcA family protein